MQLSYTHTLLCKWQCGTQAGPAMKVSERISKPEGHCLGLAPQIFNQLPGLSGMETRTSKHFYNLHINSHWDRNSIKISPWNLDTDPLEDY